MGNSTSGPVLVVQVEEEVFATPATSPRREPATSFFKRAKPPVVDASFADYHPLSGLPTPGYQGNLSKKQQAALDALRAQMAALGLTEQVAAAACAPAEDTDGLLLRFLRARGFLVPKAAELLQHDLAWRAEHAVSELTSRPEEEVLGCDPALFERYLPGWYGSSDLQGRPAQWQKWGDLRVDELLKSTSHEQLVMHHVWQQEKQMRRLAENAHAHGVLLSQCVSVVDAAHWHPALATRKAMAFLREIAGMDQAHFPERMGMIITINAPYTLSACWVVISGWLDPATRAKVQIISSDKYWKPLLATIFAPDQIPLEYGGTAPVTFGL
ncbi:CRAL-TRIO domain-containing protein [Pavlovales sp. CCMP2436]|nr:CRAL-TRIO domain-containing protein [Pavlovales sp. CCMP2436]